MEINRAIVITSFGAGRDPSSLVKNIRKFTDIDILVVATGETPVSLEATRVHRLEKDEIRWQYHPRQWVRMSNLIKAQVVLWGYPVFNERKRYNSFCCLDDDMRIVSKSFLRGFEIAEKFGVAVPTNPRIHTGLNAVGEDMDATITMKVVKEYPLLPACNLSPMFACKLNGNCRRLLEKFYEIQIERPCRGTIAMSMASWETGVTPVYLPEQWCVGRANARYLKDYSFFYRGQKCKVEPIMLHWGQTKVRGVYANYKL